MSKAWIEMIHRYLATGVGVLILTLAVASGWRATRAGPAPVVAELVADASRLPVGVVLQGAFGALTVTMKLFPAIVTLHLLLRPGAAGAAAWSQARALRARPRAQHAAHVGAGLRAVPWRQLSRSLLAAGGAGRLGQHQLRGAGLHRLSPCQGYAVAAPWSFAQGFPAVARAGRPARRQPHQLCQALTAIH